MRPLEHASLLVQKSEMLSQAPDWNTDGAEWPHRAHSQFLKAGNYTWHVQRMGAGPVAFLIHGTGSSTHSWAGLAPLLAKNFTTISVDLPGHGFTKTARWSPPSLSSVSRSVSESLSALDVEPALIIGHSAGAAIMIRMIRDGAVAPDHAVSINGAFTPFGGAAGIVFPAVARALYYNPLTAYWFSRSAGDPKSVAKLIAQTGSKISQPYIDCYATLLRRPAHISGTLGMMAHWNLSGFAKEMQALTTPTLFIAGEADKAVPPKDTEIAANLAPGGARQLLPGLGHLAHEENPEIITKLILSFASGEALRESKTESEG